MDGSLRLFSACAKIHVLLFVRKNQYDLPWFYHPSHSPLRPLPFAYLMTLSSNQFPTCFNIDFMIIPDPMSGFAFIYMEDDRDAEDAIRRLDQREFGRKGHRLRVEWTKLERGGRRPISPRRSSPNTRPSKTLFVIHFDPINTRPKDIARHFDPYGRILNVRIKRNFAFVQYELQEDATRALEATHFSKLMDRIISVEYAVDEDDDRRNGYSPDRRRNGRGRSPCPYCWGRGSPDYGYGAIPSSRQ